MKQRRKTTKQRPAPAAPVRFAVVGLGHFAQAAALPAFASARGCELKAIFSDDETKLRSLKRKYRSSTARWYDEYDR